MPTWRSRRDLPGPHGLSAGDAEAGAQRQDRALLSALGMASVSRKSLFFLGVSRAMVGSRPGPPDTPETRRRDEEREGVFGVVPSAQAPALPLGGSPPSHTPSACCPPHPAAPRRQPTPSPTPSARPPHPAPRRQPDPLGFLFTPLPRSGFALSSPPPPAPRPHSSLCHLLAQSALSPCHEGGAFRGDYKFPRETGLSLRADFPHPPSS